MTKQRLDSASLDDMLVRPKPRYVASYANEITAFMQQDGYSLLHPKRLPSVVSSSEVSCGLDIGRPVVFVTDDGTKDILFSLYREEAKVPQFPWDMRRRIPRLRPVSGSLAIGMVPPIDPFYGMLLDENEDIGFFASTFQPRSAEFLQGFARNMDFIKWGARESRSYEGCLFDDEFIVTSSSPRGPGVYPAYGGEATGIMIDLGHALADMADEAEHHFRLPAETIHIALGSDHESLYETFALFSYVRPVTKGFERNIDAEVMRTRKVLPYLDKRMDELLENSAEEEK